MKALQKSILLFALIFALPCQASSIINDSAKCKPLIDSVTKMEYYRLVDSMPQYPGGDKEILKFINDNIKMHQDIDAYGRMYIECIIDSTGNMTNFKILRSLASYYDDELIRIMKLMPKWKPGKCTGKAVNVKIVIPYLLIIE